MSGNRVALVILVLLVGLGAALFAARRDGRGAKPAGSAPLVLEPLSAPSEIVSLPGARASVPLGATQPRPILIVLPAEGESAERLCKTWRDVSGGRPFVLCPELGATRSDQVEAALRGALRELKARFGKHVAGGSVILVGYGSGAEDAVRIAQQEPSFFARLVLIDGDHSSFSATAAAAFQQRGGQRLLFVCSRESCRAAIEPKLAVIRSQNLAVELIHVGELSGMVAALRERFSWLISNEQPKRVPNPRGVVPE